MVNMTIDDAIGGTVAAQVSGIPAGLDEMEPGPFLAIVLSGIDPAALSGDDLITCLQASQRLTSHYQAVTYAAMASVVDAYQQELNLQRHHAAEAAAYELRAALHLTRRAADNELGIALDLTDRLPQVLEALTTGALDQRRARTIVWQTTHLTDPEAQEVTDRIIDQAPELTTGQLTARLRKLCAETDPDEAQNRYNHAVDNRRVVLAPTPFGTTNLSAYDLPPDRAVTATHHIDAIARSLRRDGESRTMDQLRADTLIDLLCGTATSDTNSVIELRVDLDTLTEMNNHAGHLAGYGPVTADIARNITAQRTGGQWHYTVTHNGHPIATGTTRRRPTTAQRRIVEATHPTCIFPGCRIPATQCDLDHRIEWTNNHRTNTDNLAPACRHDHTGRHTYGWTYHVHPNGDIEWTSPLDHTYTTHRNRDP